MITDWIIDIGAGAKDQYDEWTRLKPRCVIHAIEPHPHLAEKLRQKFRGMPQVIVHEFACIANCPKFRKGKPIDSQVQFFLCNPASCSSTLPLIQRNIRKWKHPAGADQLTSTDVKIVNGKTLSMFFDEQRLKKPVGLLNIDVQGNAMDVLQGISRECWELVKRIRVKVHVTDLELYQGQTQAADVIQWIMRDRFKLEEKETISRGQEQILTYVRLPPPPPPKSKPIGQRLQHERPKPKEK